MLAQEISPLEGRQNQGENDYGAIAQETRDSNKSEIIVELRSESVEGLELNIAWVVKRIHI